jgi:hypothetical protein
VKRLAYPFCVGLVATILTSAVVASCTPTQRAAAATDLATVIQGTNVVCALAESQPADAALADVVCAIVQTGEQGALVIVDALGTDAGAPAAVMAVRVRVTQAQARTLLAQHPASTSISSLLRTVDASLDVSAAETAAGVDATRTLMDAVASP